MESLDNLSLLVVDDIVLAMLADFVRHPGVRVNGAAPPWLERVTERIHDEFGRTLRLSDLASTAGVHRVHLARAFRGHYGCTVGEYVRSRRVEFATRRLLTSDLSLAEITVSVGIRAKQ